MNETYKPLPQTYLDIQKATLENGFTMASDLAACSFLRTLTGTKPGGDFLELGTGTGLSTAWILDGMDKNSSLTSIDFDDAVFHRTTIFGERSTPEIGIDRWGEMGGN